MLMDYNTILSAGHKLTYSYSSGNIPPTIGILNDTGRTEADGLTFNAYDLLGTGGDDFAGTGKWDLRYVTFGRDFGGNGKFAMTGWHDNTTINAGDTDVNFDAEFELLLDPNDLYLKLFRNNVLMLSSSNTYPTSGVQLTFAGFDNQDQSSVYVPTNLAVVLSAFGEVTTPTGFNSPLSAGQMETSTLMGVGSAGAVAYLEQGLKVNHRYIVPETWVEANILPHVTETGSKTFFGVPKDTANWSDIELNADFHSVARWHNDNGSRIQSSIVTRGTNPLDSVVNVNSLTDASYNYAIEYDGFNLNAIAHGNLGDLSTEVAASSGGTFDRALVYDSQFAGNTLSANILEIPLVMAAKEGGQVNLTTSGLSQVRIPWDTSSTVLVGENSGGNGVYGNVAADQYDAEINSHAPATLTTGGMPTLNAGSTYTFIYHPSMEAGDHVELRDANGTVYTTGSAAFDYTSDGDPGYTSPYKGFTWTVPQDVPPLNIFFYNTFDSTYDSGNGLTFSGSTYSAGVSGIDLEGPAANQTGTNIMDANEHGWISIDESLAAGERFVMNNAFFTDFLPEVMDTNNIFAIGLRGDNWANTKEVNSQTAASTGEFFKGNTYLVGVCNSTGTSVTMTVISNGTAGNSMLINSASLQPTVCAFIDITSSGNNIRMGTGRNGNLGVTQGAESTTTYANWGAYKGQTGDQGYGISSLDVVMSFWTFDGGAIDGDDIDWTLLSEIPIPGASTNATSWNKALDFSGSSERAEQVSSSLAVSPLAIDYATQITTGTNGYTSTDIRARPWAVTCVFKIDANNSNQHIWNYGEGAGSNDDNVYLRLDANQNLYFGWGRSGALNECRIATSISTMHWYGIYVAHDGRRYGGPGSTPGNLYRFFDIRLMSSHSGSWTSSTDVGTYNDWNSSASTTGGRMDRSIVGDFTVGGRGSNRNFHGKVASCVKTTLKLNDAMPTVAEAEMMITDPIGWLTNYKVTNSYRLPNASSNTSSFTLGTLNATYATQVWLMGDSPNDAFSQIRNYVWTGTQNYTPLNMISMVSNDIETVNIPGLT